MIRLHCRVFQSQKSGTSGFTLDGTAINGELQEELSLDKGFNKTLLDTTITELPFAVESLSSGTVYYLRYRYSSGDSQSGYSVGKMVETLELTEPQNVLVRNVIGDEIWLSWDEFHGATFEIEVALDQGFNDVVIGLKRLSVNMNSIVIDPLSTLTTYFIRIRSVNLAKSSDWLGLNPVTTTESLYFVLRSDDFVKRERIPSFFSCDDPPPQPNWKNPPEGTVSYAIMMDDIDVTNGFEDWILYNIPIITTDIPQGSTGGNKPSGSVEGLNSLGNRGYFGPCPPVGETHRYYFTLYALDKTFTLAGTVSGTTFLKEIESSILDRTLLNGEF
jgi:hypothetical protein